MSHEVETMAFAHAVPWHGLGNRVDPSVTPEEMLVAAGLDWTVRLAPCFAYDDQLGKALPIGRNALLRSTDNKVLTVTGDQWNPLQNAEALGFFRDFTEAGGATLETAGSLRGGKVIWGLASLNDQFTLNGNDVVKGYLLLISPHEVGNAISVRTTTVRVVCANTMAMAERSASAAYHRQNHMAPFDAKLAADAIGLSRLQLGQAKLDAETLAGLKVSEFEAVRLLARYFQPGATEMIKDEGEKAFDDFVSKLIDNTDLQSKPLEAVIDSYNNAPGAQPGTGWGVLNGVTHWADHKAGRSADARMFNSWLGERSRTKLQVQRDLLAMAE